MSPPIKTRSSLTEVGGNHRFTCCESAVEDVGAILGQNIHGFSCGGSDVDFDEDTLVSKEGADGTDIVGEDGRLVCICDGGVLSEFASNSGVFREFNELTNVARDVELNVNTGFSDVVDGGVPIMDVGVSDLIPGVVNDGGSHENYIVGGSAGADVSQIVLPGTQMISLDTIVEQSDASFKGLDSTEQLSELKTCLEFRIDGKQSSVSTVTGNEEIEFVKSQNNIQKLLMDSSSVEHCDKTSSGLLKHVLDARVLFDTVMATDQYNFQEAKVRVPSGLNISAWKSYLENYRDKEIVKYLEFGWPISFNRASHLVPTVKPHPSGSAHPESVKFYIDTELGHEALLGPFDGMPLTQLHTSPIMTRPKKDSDKRRIVLDLSWPEKFSVNDGIDADSYLDMQYKMRLPNIDLMEEKVLQLGRGAYLYKTDLSRGYRQLRVDPFDWPLLGFVHDEKFYIDICPPFGLRSAAMMMQRTSQAVSYIHRLKGFESFPYIDDFGGGELKYATSCTALQILQKTLKELGLVEAVNKICEPSQTMVWLGILFNTTEMTMSIPKGKLNEILIDLQDWDGKFHATKRQMQSMIGSMQFVAKVVPPVRLFLIRMIECMKETPMSGSHSLSLGFKQDVKFFLALLPLINGVKIMDKSVLVSKERIELDACLTGCGAWCNDRFYSRTFPEFIRNENHSIAHLEMLNLVVAIKLWAKWWKGHRIDIRSDNMNTCILVMRGKSVDPYMQRCARELYLVTATNDIDLNVIHTPGVELTVADALSRRHLDQKFDKIVRNSVELRKAKREHPPDHLFELRNDI